MGPDRKLIGSKDRDALIPEVLPPIEEISDTLEKILALEHFIGFTSLTKQQRKGILAQLNSIKQSLKKEGV